MCIRDRDAIVATDRVTSWDLPSSLSDVFGNMVCETLFLLAKDNAERARAGQLELLGLFPGGFNGSLHAKTGASAGLIKSILREMPQLRCNVLCTESPDLGAALERLALERGVGLPEPEVSWLEGRLSLIHISEPTRPY